MKQYKLTYYWWYRILVTVIALLLIYFFTFLWVDIWMHDMGIFPLIIVGLIALSIIALAGFYLLYIYTYRLTVSQESIESKTIFSRSSIPIDDARLAVFDIFGSTIVSPYDNKSIHVSPYVAKSSHLAHDLLQEEEDSTVDGPGVAPKEVIASLQEYVTLQRIFMALPFISLFNLFYGFVQIYVDIISPIASIGIYLISLIIMLYLWTKVIWHPLPYMPQHLDVDHSLLLLNMGTWTALHTVGLYFKYIMLHTMVLLVISIGISILLYSLPRVRNFLVHRLYFAGDLRWGILIGLPLTVFNLIGGVNCLPFGTTYTVEAPIEDKVRLYGLVPVFSLSVSLWADSDGLILTTPPIYEEVAIGDTVSLDIYPGVLGIPWTRGSYLGPYIDSLRYRETTKP